MSTGVCIIHWIVIAIAIQVQAVGGFGIEVGGIIGRDESAPFGAVIPGVAVIQTSILGGVLAKRLLGSFVGLAKCYPYRTILGVTAISTKGRLLF